MDVSEKFKAFCSNILISDENVENISCRYKRITKQLNKDFWNSESDQYHSLYVGSYGRGTETRTSDIDMIFELPSKKYHQYNDYKGNGQSALLQEVKKSIEKTYSVTSIGADGQVIVVPFNDGITFEVVPVFVNTSDTYTYPDSNAGGSWKTTNPRAEIKAISDANKAWNYNLKDLCRMGREWKKEWGVPMGGLLIDTLAYNFLSTSDYKDKGYVYYDWMVRDFLKYLKDRDDNTSYWLAPGSNARVYKKGGFQYKALMAYNKALEAIKYGNDGYDVSAVQKWREVLGNKF